MMPTSKRVKTTVDDTTPQVPQTEPDARGDYAGRHDFTLQVIMELQKTVVETNTRMVSVESSVNSLKTKIDDLVAWKHRILGGAAVLAVVIGAIGYVLGKASDYVTLKPQAATVTSEANKTAGASKP